MHQGGRQESTRICFCFGFFPRMVLGICCFSISNEYVRIRCRFLSHYNSDEQLEELGIRSLFRNEVELHPHEVFILSLVYRRIPMFYNNDPIN